LSCNIPDGTDLSEIKNLMLENITIGKDVKFPTKVKFIGQELTEDFSSVEVLELSGRDTLIGKTAKLAKKVTGNYVTLSGNIPDGTDLSQMENLTLTGDITIGKDVKLPSEVKFRMANLKQDMSAYSDTVMYFSGCTFAEGFHLPNSAKAEINGRAVVTNEKALSDVQTHLKGYTQLTLDEKIPLNKEILERVFGDVLIVKSHAIESFEKNNQPEDYANVVLSICEYQSGKNEQVAKGAKNVYTREEYLKRYKESVFLTTGEALNRSDLKDFQCEILQISGRFEEQQDISKLDLPQSVKKITLSHCTAIPELKDSCEHICLEFYDFAEGTTVDLSKCKRIELSNVDFSKAHVILPKEAESIRVGDYVKFPKGYELDLSGVEKGFVNTNVECASIKMPKQLLSNEYIRDVPSQTVEISTGFLKSCGSAKLKIPDGAKIIDLTDENGHKIPLDLLERRGVSKKRIKELKKSRRKEKIKYIFKKATNLLSKDAKPEARSKEEDKKAYERIRLLRGAPQTQTTRVNKPNKPAKGKNMFQKVIDSVKSKFAKPKEKTTEEKAKDKKTYKIIQTLRGVLRPKKSRKAAEAENVQTNEQVAIRQVIEQRDVGR